MLSNLVKAGFSVAVIYGAIYPVLNSPAPLELKDITPVVEAKKVEVKKPKQAEKPVIVNVNLPDFSKYRDVKEKKRAFFAFLRPFVEQINTEIEAQRLLVKNLDLQTSSQENRDEFQRLLKAYKVEASQSITVDNIGPLKQELLKRLDIIPVELVLMQAANESAWGTSRFALQANNLFGQWCFRKGCGIVPKGRPEGETYEVRKFNSPKQSIRGYFFNINAGYAYEELRTLRATLRAMNEEIDPYVIAEGLIPYSTRREAYVDEIQNMIRINKKYI